MKLLGDMYILDAWEEVAKDVELFAKRYVEIVKAIHAYIGVGTTPDGLDVPYIIAVKTKLDETEKKAVLAMYATLDA